MQHHLRVELANHELLAIELPSAVEVRAVSGYHWLTVDGLDVCLAPGERDTVPAGTILAEGRGQLEFSPSSAVRAHGAEDRAAQGTMLLGKVCF